MLKLFIAKLTHLGSWHVEAFFEYGWLRFRGDIRIESSFFLPRGFNEQLSNEHGEYPRKIETTVYVKIHRWVRIKKKVVKITWHGPFKVVYNIMCMQYLVQYINKTFFLFLCECHTFISFFFSQFEFRQIWPLGGIFQGWWPRLGWGWVGWGGGVKVGIVVGVQYTHG